MGGLRSLRRSVERHHLSHGKTVVTRTIGKQIFPDKKGKGFRKAFLMWMQKLRGEKDAEG